MEVDHCTGWFEGSWWPCCKNHDVRYSNTLITRYQADILLYRCVKRKSNIFMAAWMFAGVRLFGANNYKRINDENNTNGDIQ